MIGGGAAFKTTIGHLYFYCLGINRATVIVSCVCTSGGTAIKYGVFDGGFFPIARRFVISINKSMINCAAIRCGTTILERAVFHTQLRSFGFNRAAVGPVVPICQAILKITVFDSR